MADRIPIPNAIYYHRKSRTLDLSYADGHHFSLSAEYLRVFSPSAEVRGHAPGQETLQLGKHDVEIDRIEPVGRYAIRLVFDDGHDSGIYTWDELRQLGDHYSQNWEDYLGQLEETGHKHPTDCSE